VRIEMLDPASVGQPIGHFGFFRREIAGDLWPGYTQWLLS
jgi:predicted alpha/beta hydrolase